MPYKVESNDGDIYLATTIDQATRILKKRLEEAANEQETKEWCGFEVCYITREEYDRIHRESKRDG